MYALMYSPDFVSRGTLPVLSGKLILRRNDVSTFQLEIDGGDAKAGRYAKGWRVVVIDEGVQLVAGYATSISYRQAAGVRDVTISGQSDMAWLGQRLTLPDPTSTPDKQALSSYWKLKGPSETVVREMVRLNVSQDALAIRRAPLVVEPDQGRGATVSANSRFKKVLEEAQSLAGGLTFSIHQDLEQAHSVLTFREGRDLRRAVNLTEASGALTETSMSMTAPTTTAVLVAGQGEGNARTLRMVSGNTNDWGVYSEDFQDRRDTDDLAELQQAGEDTLLEAQETATAAFEVQETKAKRFGTHFLLGDTITITAANQTQVADIVQQADIDIGADGRTVKLQVGPVAGDDNAPTFVALVKRLDKRIRQLEAR